MAKKATAAKKKTGRSMGGTAKTGEKNSLVGNINRRKKAGKSRSKRDSTISDEAYTEMGKGWPTASKKTS